MKIHSDRGIALVLSLFLTAAMSVLAVSLMFLSQTETYSSMNYRLMSQARYGAESGLEKAVNFLLNSYTKPSTGGADAIGNYNLTVSPVTYNGQPVILSANASQASNYPVAAVQSAFSTAVQGTLPSGSTTVAYAPYAKLLSMQEVQVYGGGTETIQTWQITSTGTITAGRTAQVEVAAVLETQKAPATLYAAFGVSGGCGALQFAGGSTTDSYSSVSNGVPVSDNPPHGNVGTNGNLTESGGATINGSLATPRVGVGNCSNGNVDALTSSGGATVTEGVVQLPQSVTLAPPAAPVGVPTGNVVYNSDTVLTPGTYADIKVTGNSKLTLSAGTYNLNSLDIASGSTIYFNTGPIILNIAGAGKTDVVSFAGSAQIVNDINTGSPPTLSYDSSMFLINYSGTANIKLTGGSQTAAMVYAPQAAITFSGNSDFYGAVVGNTIKDTGGAHLHFDTRLEEHFFVVGTGMVSSFSWKKY